MTNMVTVQNFEVMSFIFYTVGICIIGNAQKYVAKIRNCVGFGSHRKSSVLWAVMPCRPVKVR
jgi:hypothetical protein